MKMMFAACLWTLAAACLVWYKSWRQFREAAYHFRNRLQSIHLREKNIAGPPLRDQKMRKHFLSSQKGPAFFDEDDVCSWP